MERCEKDPISVFAPESLDLSSLPHLSLSEKRNLPSCSAVYFALSSKGRVLYVGRSIDICERLRNHHRVPLLEALGGVKIAWFEQNNSFVLPRIERTLIKYFNPPLNRIPSYLNKEKSEKLIKYLNLTDDITKPNVIPINRLGIPQSNKKNELPNQIQAEKNFRPALEHGEWSSSKFKELILEQAETIGHLEERLADLKLMFQEQLQAHRQLTEAIVEQAKAISDLSRTQTETHTRLSKVTVEQALTINKLSSILEETCHQNKAGD